MAKPIEEYLDLFSSRLEKSDQRLSWNLGAHIILVSLSVYSILESPTPLKGLAEKYFSFDGDKGDIRVLYGILALLLLYVFMRWAFLLGTFVIIRLGSDELLTRILKGPHIHSNENEIIARVFTTSNFYEPLFQSEKKPSVCWLVIGLSILLAGLNNASVFVYIHLIILDTPRAVALNVLVFLFIITVYYQGYYSPVAEKNISVRVFAWAAPMLGVALYLLYLVKPLLN